MKTFAWIFLCIAIAISITSGIFSFLAYRGVKELPRVNEIYKVEGQVAVSGIEGYVINNGMRRIMITKENVTRGSFSTAQFFILISREGEKEKFEAISKW